MNQRTSIEFRHEAYANAMPYLSGSSSLMQDPREQASNPPSHYPATVIVGEDGVGKSAIAEYVCSRAHDSGETLVTLDCDAVHSQQMWQATPGIADLVDRPESLHDSVLLLKDVDRAPDWLQEVLLRSATTLRLLRPPMTCISTVTSEETFATLRPDLQAMLNHHMLHIPSLRDHLEDLDEIAVTTLDRLHHYGAHARITDDAVQALHWYSWPGNTSQLIRFIERHASRSGSDITLKDVFVESDSHAHACKSQPSSVKVRLPDDGLDLKGFLRGVERDLIEQALAANDNVVAHAAKFLQIKRSTLVEKINRLDM